MANHCTVRELINKDPIPERKYAGWGLFLLRIWYNYEHEYKNLQNGAFG